MSENREDCLWQSSIVYIAITLFTLEGISRKGHMISMLNALNKVKHFEIRGPKVFFHC